jgi:superfamily II DNA or RNA helicase
MMEQLHLTKADEAFIKVNCEPSIAQELSDHFTFDVPGAKYMPAYRNKMWDGKIRLFNTMTRTIYAGLYQRIVEFANDRKYETIDDGSFNDYNLSLVEARRFIESLNLPFQPRDYQLEAFVDCVRKQRRLVLSPTASGKSLIIYMIAMWYASQQHKILVIVPTISLVHQMSSDFKSYGFPDDVHMILGGKEKNSNARIVVSTWQSIYELPKKWFAQFGVVFGDEAHLYKAKSLVSVMTKLSGCKYRFGLTGTLDGTQTHQLVLEGLFGSVKQTTTTAQLIKEKHLSEFNIKAIVLNYPDADRQAQKGNTYPDEVDFLVAHKNRNNFIKNLALSLPGNTLLLFKLVEKHGDDLYDDIVKMSEGKTIYYIHGSVSGEERERIRLQVERSTNNIIVASYGTFSTGVNITNLHNVIFASPSKSRIRTLQSIGRTLRRNDAKQVATLYDIADNVAWKKWENHTLKHFRERIKIYNEEQFDYKIYNVDLGG